MHRSAGTGSFRFLISGLYGLLFSASLGAGESVVDDTHGFSLRRPDGFTPSAEMAAR
jgi:hypothetical protein